MANRDLLQPFYKADQNREETFLIEMGGFLYNRSAHIVTAMLMNYEHYVEDFPLIKIFKGMSTYKIFIATKLFNPLETLNQLSRFRITPETPEKTIEETLMLYRLVMDEIEEVDTRGYLVMPIFAYSISQIIKETCCRKIYIANPLKFSEWEIEYIRDLYGHKLDKIELVVGDTLDLYKEHIKDLTTIFVNDAYMFHKLSNEVDNGSIDKSVINNQLFCLRVSDDIVEKKDNIDMYQYTCGDLIESCEKNKIHISVMPTLPITDHDTNKIVLPNAN